MASRWLPRENAPPVHADHRTKKPRIGSGRAVPRDFHAPARGNLVIASDGLFGHATLDDVVSVVLADPGRSATALVQLLEQRHRALPDDVAIIVAQLSG